ncbi:MAG: cache domain-containing protein [Bacteroidales bacterium]|nr:cache domain-containing protein [Bacteroidales bacterium]
MAVEACESKGEGFIEYYWSKPSDSMANLTIKKVSYVRLFEPWQWVIGTGVYLEDIEDDTHIRKLAMIEDLKTTIGKIRIGESGYFFIFDGKKDVLLHPYLMTSSPDSSYYFSALPIMDKIMKAAKTKDKTLRYSWLDPTSDDNQVNHPKKVFVAYYEPLDWYICASISEEEIKHPTTVLGRKILYFALIFIAFSAIVAFIMAENLARPLRNLMASVLRISNSQDEIDVKQIPVSGSTEMQSLSLSIRDMLRSIRQQKRNLLDAKVEVEESEKKYRMLFNSSGDAALMFKDFKITECNERALKILKGSREEVLGITLWDISPILQAKGIKSSDKAREIFKDAKVGFPMEFEWIHTNLAKELLNIDVTLTFLDKDKNVFLSTWRDVTAKKLAEKALRESEERYRFLVENSPTVFWIFNKEGDARYISSNITKVLGFTSEEIKGMTIHLWHSRIHRQDIENVIYRFNDLYEHNIPVDVSYRFINSKGKWIWLQEIARKDDEIFGNGYSFGLVTDITEKKVAEQKILQSMIKAEEDERSRIAKDLHDGVSPLLSAIKLFTQSMRDSKMEKMKIELSEKISYTVAEAIQSINEISANISPHILQNFGLVTAVESFAISICPSHGVSFTVDSDFSGRLPDDYEIALYRIAVELINNTLKYANAKKIQIVFSKLPIYVGMSYSDDGIGFDMEKTKEYSKSMGLFNMKNRTELLNGKFKLTSAPNAGTQAYIQFPLDTLL